MRASEASYTQHGGLLGDIHIGMSGYSHYLETLR